MTTIRVEKDREYFSVSNKPFNDKSLSWEARGVLGYLLSKPDDWQVRLQDLIRQGPAGEHKINRVMAELKKAGYMERTRVSCPGGTFDWLTTIYETPEMREQSTTIPRKSRHGNHTPKIQSLDNPGTGKPRHIASTDLTSTEKQKTEKAAAAASVLSSKSKNEEPKNMQLFSDEIRPPSLEEERRLIELEESFSVEWVADAIREAVRTRGKALNFPLKYLFKILERWSREGHDCGKLFSLDAIWEFADEHGVSVDVAERMMNESVKSEAGRATGSEPKVMQALRDWERITNGNDRQGFVETTVANFVGEVAA